MSEVPLPKDHEGREIPLDTMVLYDAKGGEMYVSGYRYQRDVLGLFTGWNVTSEDAAGQCWQYPADSLYLNRPDSWEKLLEDLGRCISGDSACRYFAASENCEDCRIDRNNEQGGCVELVFKDIVRRIRKLRGEVREDA